MRKYKARSRAGRISEVLASLGVHWPDELAVWRNSRHTLAVVEALYSSDGIPPAVFYHLLEQRRRDEITALQDRAVYWENIAKEVREQLKRSITAKIPVLVNPGPNGKAS